MKEMSSNLSSSFHQFKFEVANATRHSIYYFDGFRLDGDRLMLYRGELPTALPPKAVETLAVLVRRRGEIVGKDELIDAVWRDSIVEDSNLTQYLYLIRKTLGPRADGGQYIETLRKRGYRFDSDTFRVETDPYSAASESLGDQPAASVEARTNVYQFTTAPKEAGRDESPSAKRSRARKFALIAGGQAAVLLVIVIGAIVWFGSVASSEKPVQLNLIRLTNGLEVVDAVVSPDGKYFAYHELDGERSHIWVQQTGQSNRLEIVTWIDRWHGAKTFTPDGQFLYFAEADGTGGNSVYRVPTLGGPKVKVLSDVSGPVSFSPDGREFVFYRYSKPSGEKQIVIRSTDGTEQERVIYSLTELEQPFSYVAWSPRGGRIAFSSTRSGGPTAVCTYYWVDAAGGEPQPLSHESWEACHRIAWRPDGMGLYAIATKSGDGYSTRRDQLYCISLTDGKATRMTTDGSRHQLDSLSVTEKGEVLVVPYNRSSQIWSMDPNGDSRTAEQISTGLADGRAGIAPMTDGRIAYVARSAESLNVWLMNSDGSEQKQLTSEPQYLEELRASGDGRYLFFSVPNGKWNDIFRINSDGSDIRQLTTGMHAIDSGPSHDGKWLAYGGGAVSDHSAEYSLYKLPLEGGAPVRFEIKDCGRPHFSPDDKYISCVENQERIYILSAASGSVIRSFLAPPRSTLNFGARWTPDGKALVYIVTEKDVSNLWLQPVDGSPPRRSTDFTAGSIYHFAYSRDGKRLYLARGTQIRDAVLISDSSD